MHNELLNNVLFEQVNELVRQNTDVIIHTFQAACPGLAEETLAAGIVAIRLATQLSLFATIKLFEDIGLLKLPNDGQAILKILD